MLGSRQYDPTTARFTTPDTFIAAQLDLQLGTDSLTGNRYLFAAANPLAFYEDGHGMFSRLKKLSKRALPALQYVPVVSTAIDVASAATGRNWYEGGRRMKGGERLAMLAGSTSGLIPGGGIAKLGVVGALKGVQKAKQAHKARKAADSCVANSFTPATLVLMADGTSTPISDIEIGDLVWAADPETDQAGPRQVTDLIEGTGVKKLVDITVAGDTDGPLTATDGHPIWVEHQGWTDADDLALGDLLRQADGDLVPITALRAHTAQGATVHNLTVDDLHTYYVIADDPVLVHNCGGTSLTSAANALKSVNDGKNRVTAGTGGRGRWSLDLEGEAHYERKLKRSVPTPHVKWRKEGMRKRDVVTRPVSWSDLRIARRLLEQRSGRKIRW